MPMSDSELDALQKAAPSQAPSAPSSDAKLKALQDANPSPSSMQNTLKLLGAGQPYGGGTSI